MAISRRHLLLGTAAAVATSGQPARGAARSRDTLPTDASPKVGIGATGTVPSPVVVALHRMSWGPRPGDIESIGTLGLDPYIEQQLSPGTLDDTACDERIARTKLRITYGSGPGAVDELRPLTALNKPLSELWPLAQHTVSMDWRERMRPWEEVRVATCIRATYSVRQLQEVLVDFWHNHFNVHASSHSAIAATFPIYDREVIRRHCLGNFRVFLEAVARSTAMLYYLDNVSNQAGGGEGGNENYARELFELHTLGSDNYLKFYDDRRRIDADVDGNARGYIDDDVYEAARCFSGWTVANGAWQRPSPNTGEFLYDPSWHDTGPKTVLSPDGFPNIRRNLPALEDGRRVLDLLARHRGTARHLCTKLCRRFIGDHPPPRVVDAAVETWMSSIDEPDQIKRVMRVILTASEFQTTWGNKIKRPFDALASYLRATNAELPNDVIDPLDPQRGAYWAALNWNIESTGHRLFEWPTAMGHPEDMEYWSSTDGMLRRWNLLFIVTQPWGGNILVDLASQTPAGATCTAVVDFWIGRLCGFSINPAVRAELISFMAQGGDPNRPPAPTVKAPDWGKEEALVDRLNSMVHLLAMCPDFQMR